MHGNFEKLLSTVVITKSNGEVVHTGSKTLPNAVHKSLPRSRFRTKRMMLQPVRTKGIVKWTAQYAARFIADTWAGLEQSLGMEGGLAAAVRIATSLGMPASPGFRGTVIGAAYYLRGLHDYYTLGKALPRKIKSRNADSLLQEFAIANQAHLKSPSQETAERLTKLRREYHAATGRGGSMDDDAKPHKIHRPIEQIQRDIAKIETRMDKIFSNYQSPLSGGTRARSTSFNANQGKLAQSLSAIKQELREATEGGGKSLSYRVKQQAGPCTPGHTQARDGCTPVDGEGGKGPSPKKTDQSKSERNQTKAKETPVPDHLIPEGEHLMKAPCCLSNPDPTKIDHKTGVTKHSRIGVAGMLAPPPPAVIDRLPNLTDVERKAETRFADAYLSNHEEMIAEYGKRRNHLVGYEFKIGNASELEKAAKEAGIKIKIKHDDKKNRDEVKLSGEREQLDALLAKAKVSGASPVYEVGDAPNIFNTDDAKMLSPDYNPQGVSEDEVKNARGVFNAAVHTTANALAKRAFIDYLDSTVANLPEERRTVLVTSGGVAAGKGYALKSTEKGRQLSEQAGAVWDAAGEQNATENPWVLEECKKRGIKPVFAFVNADPKSTWDNPDRGVVERANKIGRMVDARLFADSYAIGAKNFHSFHEKHKEDPDIGFIVIDNSKGSEPAVLSDVPQEALNQNSNDIYKTSMQVIEERADNLRPSVVRGGTVGTRIWGEQPEKSVKEKDNG